MFDRDFDFGADTGQHGQNPGGTAVDRNRNIDGRIWRAGPGLLDTELHHLLFADNAELRRCLQDDAAVAFAAPMAAASAVIRTTIRGIEPEPAREPVRLDGPDGADGPLAPLASSS